MNFDQIVAQIQTLPLVNLQLAGLPVELTMLALATLLGMLQLSVSARMINGQRGVQWNLGARDGEPPPVTAVASRLDRAYRNFMETYPFFAVMTLIGFVMARHNWASLAGTQIYFWARVVYVPLYAAGVPGIRTLVWLIGSIGLILVFASVFLA